MTLLTTKVTVTVDMQPVESSNLAAAGFVPGVGIFVQFKSGAIYRYPLTSKVVFDALLDAESKGKFFNEHIKPMAFEKLDPQPVVEAA